MKPCSTKPIQSPLSHTNSEAWRLFRADFFAVEAINPIDARWFSFTAQQHEQAAIAKPPPFVGQLPQTTTQGRIRRTLRNIPDHLAIRARNPARPPFREPELASQLRDSFALDGGRHHFFETNSRIAARSSICSASSFFSLAFSSSSVFSRLASDTVIPPNLAFQL